MGCRVGNTVLDIIEEDNLLEKCTKTGEYMKTKADQLMADVTGIPGVAAGDPVTLLGGGIGYTEYAAWAGTNRNECLTILSQRPQRVYREGS